MIGSPPEAQTSRRFVAVDCGTLCDWFAHTGGEPAPMRRRTVLVGPTSSAPPAPLPGETPRKVNESSPDCPGFGVYVTHWSVLVWAEGGLTVPFVGLLVTNTSGDPAPEPPVQSMKIGVAALCGTPTFMSLQVGAAA